MKMSEHLSPDLAASYVDGTLAQARQPDVEAHLADCAACREEIVAVRALVRPARRTSVLLPVAAAAALAVVALGITMRSGEQPVVLRGEEVPVAIEMKAPADHASLDSTGAFMWRPVANAVEYRLTLTTDAGDVVADRVTPDTIATIKHPPAGTYRWYVTAILSDGSVLSSRTRAFTVQ
jgi:anti-sigma factor ChrR (cupin superfamily)